MGRLNYTNRRSEGLKMGQVCFKDLVKRIPPGSGLKAALRDPVLELDISSKYLGESGLAEVAQGLVQTYEANTHQHTVLRLEELNLSHNDLTPRCLETLAKVISLACNDLKDLDLSYNEFSLPAEEDLRNWEMFLASISRCCKLRRLSIRGNTLGFKAYEALLRVYSQERPVDLVLPPDLTSDTGIASLNSVTDTLTLGNQLDHEKDNDEDLNKVSRRGSRHASKWPDKPEVLRSESLHLSEVYATTKGLRSIPYIDLGNTSIDETSALYLSYIIAHHHKLEKLLSRVPPARPGAQVQQLELYDTESHCRGIIYLPNPSLEASAHRVLSLAERLRNSLDKSTVESSEAFVLRPSTEQVLPTTPGHVWHHGHRRHLSSASGDETEESIAADLDRARSRLQVYTIENYGYQCNALWTTAMRMLAFSRILQPTRPSEPPLVAPLVAPSKPKQLIVRTLDIPSSAPKKANPWGLPLTPKSTNVNTSTRSINGKDRVTSTWPASISRSDQMRPNAEMTPVSGFEYRSRLPLGLPEEIWCRILGQAVDAQGVLSPGQQRSVLKYGRSKCSLGKERDALGLKKAFQIWHVLDSMDCLAYEMR